MSTSTTRTSLPPDLSLEVFTNRGIMPNIAEYLPLTDQVALAKTCKAIHQIMTGKVIGPARSPISNGYQLRDQHRNHHHANERANGNRWAQDKSS